MNPGRWEKAFREKGRIWGDQPSELAREADRFAREAGLSLSGLRILDAGCGYGRDAFFLAGRWACRVTGVDEAPTAIEMARAGEHPVKPASAEFLCSALETLNLEPFDALFASNFYTVLDAEKRAAFPALASRCLRPGGYLFLSNLSNRDPEVPRGDASVTGDDDTLTLPGGLFLANRRELERRFSGFRLLRLYEHEFSEPQTDGPNHHHRLWILIAQRPDERVDARPKEMV